VARGDYLTGGCAEFNANFPLLAAAGLAFDLHVNWFQLKQAAAFAAGQGAAAALAAAFRSKKN
jgi:predicted TIM-barrel fold metal-dependent hydrolase